MNTAGKQISPEIGFSQYYQRIFAVTSKSSFQVKLIFTLCQYEVSRRSISSLNVKNYAKLWFLELYPLLPISFRRPVSFVVSPQTFKTSPKWTYTTEFWWT